MIVQAGSQGDQAQHDALYAQVAQLLAQHTPMIPVANGGSAMAYKKTVQNPQASPLTSEILAKIGIPGQDQFVLVQNGEPGGLYCADESDSEALRVCDQIGESLLAYRLNGTEVEPSLAEKYESSVDLKEWTFYLPKESSSRTARTSTNDVVKSYRVQVGRRRSAPSGAGRRLPLLLSIVRRFPEPAAELINRWQAETPT